MKKTIEKHELPPISDKNETHKGCDHKDIKWFQPKPCIYESTVGDIVYTYKF